MLKSPPAGRFVQRQHAHAADMRAWYQDVIDWSQDGARLMARGYAIRTLHQQDQQLLPGPVQAKLAVPDAMSWFKNLVGRLPNSSGWEQVLGKPLAFSETQFKQLLAVDPCCVPRDERVVRDYIEGRR